MLSNNTLETNLTDPFIRLSEQPALSQWELLLDIQNVCYLAREELVKRFDAVKAGLTANLLAQISLNILAKTMQELQISLTEQKTTATATNTQMRVELAKLKETTEAQFIQLNNQLLFINTRLSLTWWDKLKLFLNIR